jgi:hypothetical protein
MERDELYDIFSQHLNQADPERFDIQEFTFEVTSSYIYQLMQQGNIPHKMLDLLETDIREEVDVMFKKVTYGFLTFKDYQASKKRTQQSRKKS